MSSFIWSLKTKQTEATSRANRPNADLGRDGNCSHTYRETWGPSIKYVVLEGEGSKKVTVCDSGRGNDQRDITLSV